MINSLKTLLSFCAILCISIQSMAQSKNDYNWIITKHFEQSTPEAEGYHWKFTEDGLVRDYLETPDGIFRHISTMSDHEGNLQFYSNGCAVYNADHQLMQNGDGVNDVSKEFDEFCPGGYVGINNMVAIPDPKNMKGYYLIHKPVEESSTKQILYSYIDMELDGGLGGVSSKNNLLYDDTNIRYGHINACKHANGKDWWFTQIVDSTNTFLIFLVDEEGITLQKSISTGIPFFERSGSFTQVVYNRDGSKFAMNGIEHDVLVYDFDRLTGQLTFDQQIIVPINNPFDLSRGAMFSPNNRFLYVNTERKFYQIDMWEDDLQESLELIAEYDGFEEETVGVPVVFGNLVHGPDCKIYMTTASGIQYMHMIEFPDEKGQACGFQQHSIKLDIPAPSYYSNTIPFYRMDEPAPCDPTLVGIADIFAVDHVPVEIYPNPATTQFTLSVEPDAEIVRYEILSLEGMVLRSGDVLDLETSIDISQYASGMYFIRVYDADGESHVEKWVKE